MKTLALGALILASLLSLGCADLRGTVRVWSGRLRSDGQAGHGAQGWGVVVSKGRVLTVQHVGLAGSEVRVEGLDGRWYEAKRIGRLAREPEDLLLLEVPGAKLPDPVRLWAARRGTSGSPLFDEHGNAMGLFYGRKNTGVLLVVPTMEGAVR